MMNRTALKFLLATLLLLTGIFMPASFVYASNIIPAEVIKTADPIKASDTTFTQQVILRFPSENQNRTEAVVLNYPNSTIKSPLKQGDKVSVRVDANASSKYEIIGYERVNDLIWLPAGFIALYVILLGTKNIKRLIMQIGVVTLSLVGLFVGTLINQTAVTSLITAITIGFIFFFLKFRRKLLTLIAGLSSGVSMIVLFIISFLLIDILKIQFSVVGSLLSFYNLNSTLNPSNLIISCVIIASTGGVLAVISHSVKEAVALKAREKDIERNKLMIKSARESIKWLQDKTFTLLMLLIGLLALFIVPFLNATNISNTLNSDPIASILSFVFLVLTGWLICVPVVALIQGFILGRVQSHKLVSADIIDEFEGVL